MEVRVLEVLYKQKEEGRGRGRFRALKQGGEKAGRSKREMRLGNVCLRNENYKSVKCYWTVRAI